MEPPTPETGPSGSDAASRDVAPETPDVAPEAPEVAAGTPSTDPPPPETPSADVPSGPPADPVTDAAVPGWRPDATASSGTGRQIGCVIVAVVGGLIALALVAIIALIFLGGQVRSILAGTVAFGASGSACSVNDASTSLPASGPIHIVGYLEREAQPGEVIRLEVVTEGERLPISEEPVAEPTECIHLSIPAGDGAPGTYTFEFFVEQELLATGTLQLTP
jgi:hypothetical protein